MEKLETIRDPEVLIEYQPGFNCYYFSRLQRKINSKLDRIYRIFSSGVFYQTDSMIWERNNISYEIAKEMEGGQHYFDEMLLAHSREILEYVRKILPTMLKREHGSLRSVVAGVIGHIPKSVFADLPLSSTMKISETILSKTNKSKDPNRDYFIETEKFLFNYWLDNLSEDVKSKQDIILSDMITNRLRAIWFSAEYFLQNFPRLMFVYPERNDDNDFDSGSECSSDSEGPVKSCLNGCSECGEKKID